MSRVWLVAGLAGLALVGRCAAQQEATLMVSGFEVEALGFDFVPGNEFPGARGSLTADTSTARGGKASACLAGDFTDGGAYVGVWTNLPDQGGKNLAEVRLWVKTTDVSSLGVRIVDSTGQCHQSQAPALVADGEWHEVVLPLAGLVGGEHWGGANDGKWHGPAKGFGVNLGKDGFVGGAKAGRLWLDDVSLSLTGEQLGRPTVLPAQIAPDRCRPGFGVHVTYRWQAEPMGRDFTVFVHVVGPDGTTVTQADHDPPVGTAVWEGAVEYERLLVLPVDAPEGRYRILLGLYDHAASQRGWDHQTLTAAEGVTALEDGTTCEIGTFTVDAGAPLPELGPPNLDLAGYRETFVEEFDGPLDVSAWGPGTRWIAHTPYAGDFGDAGFGDPGPDSPFTVEDGLLRIEAKKVGDRWRAGLLSSVDPKGEGFSQKFGYFEMRAKLPKGAGTWPAFWLLSADQLKDRSKTGVEIDVVEEYGVNPYVLHATVHLWYPDGTHWAEGWPHLVQGMTDDFHTYGVMVTEEEIIFYYDRAEIRRTKTPPEAHAHLYLLVNLALGGGWPIDQTPDPSVMEVDYVRAWSR